MSNKNISKEKEQEIELNGEDLNALPQTFKSVWITNKRLQKQINILRIQIAQKDRIIRQLKVQIDSNILQDTKSKLEFLRMVQDQVNQKTKQARQQYLKKMANFQAQFERRTSLVFSIEKQLQFEKQQNRKLCTKIKDLKQHIIMALDQKDLIIKELTKIINNQDMDAKVQKIKQHAGKFQDVPRPASALLNFQMKDTYRKKSIQEAEVRKQAGRFQPKYQNPTSKVKIKRNV